MVSSWIGGPRRPRGGGATTQAVFGPSKWAWLIGVRKSPRLAVGVPFEEAVPEATRERVRREEPAKLAKKPVQLAGISARDHWNELSCLA